MKTFNCDEFLKKYNKKQKLLQPMEKEHNTKYEKTASYVEFVVANSQRAEM